MKGVVTATVVVLAIVLGLSGVAMARWGQPGMGMGGPCWDQDGSTQADSQEQGRAWGPRRGMRGGMMGRGMGGGMMGGGWGPGGPGPNAGAPAGAQAIDEAKAKEIAGEYVTKSLPGYSVQKVAPFQGRRGTMYQVELRGPKDEVRYIHINPWGAIRETPRRTF
jgi:hypothetical protein